MTDVMTMSTSRGRQGTHWSMNYYIKLFFMPTCKFWKEAKPIPQIWKCLLILGVIIYTDNLYYLKPIGHLSSRSYLPITTPAFSITLRFFMPSLVRNVSPWLQIRTTWLAFFTSSLWLPDILEWALTPCSVVQRGFRERGKYLYRRV